MASGGTVDALYLAGQPGLVTWSGSACSTADQPPAGWFDVIEDVEVLSATDIYIGGTSAGKGRIAHFDGSVWTTLVQGDNDAIHDLWIANGRIFLAKGQHQAYFEVASGALACDASISECYDEYPLDLGPGNEPALAYLYPLAIWGVDENDFWVGGDAVSPFSAYLLGSGPVVHIVNGLPQPAHLAARTILTQVEAIHGNGPDDVWFAGSSNSNGSITLLHWDGLLGTFDVVTEIGHIQLNDIHAVSADDVWAVGPTGAWHFDGLDWSHPEIGLEQPFTLRGVWATDAEVWVVGDQFNPWNPGAVVLRRAGGLWSLQ